MSEPLRVLFVDDSEKDVFLLLRQLKKGGFEPQHKRVDDAVSLRTALQTDEWQIVISDFHMPNFDGLMALQVFKEAELDIPFILVSATVGEETAVLAMKQGAHDYIMKGNLTRLAPVVQRELREAEMRAQQRRTQSALQQREEQLRQSQKMEAIGRLAAGAAHDFKNVLTVILGQSQLLMREKDVSASQRSKLEHIQNATDKASSLIVRLLAFSRKQELKPQALNLSTEVNAMKPMLAPLLGNSIQFVVLPEPNLGSCEVDANSLEQVIINLVINARDAMPSGGTVTIGTANLSITQENAVHHGGVPQGDYILLTVTDSGTGMTEETRKHLFEPFFTTKESGKGTGLGLSTCYGTIHQSGGHIVVHSELGKGSSFRVYLPRVKSNAVNQSTDTDPALNGECPEEAFLETPTPELSDASGVSGTVLLAEDEQVIRELMASTLREMGCNVLEAGDGEQALRLLENSNGQEIDLLLTDIVMPVMGGKELAYKVGSRFPATKIIFCSAYPEKLGVRNGMFDKQIPFLQKPVTTDALKLKVREVLGDAQAATVTGQN
jgi:two-component system, cell cycle sensor histidine kinase and response regulator CckA